MGQVLGVSFDLTNTLDSTNNVTGAQDWQVTNGSEDSGVAGVGWNCAQNDVFRIEVVCVSCGPANSTITIPCAQIGQLAVMNETMMLMPSLFANSNGTYTIVGGDEWGQTVVLHFQVSHFFAPSLNGTCLKEMPANAMIENFQNSTFTGYNVSMPAGSISYFPLGGCPSPVSPKLFTVAAQNEALPKFIAAEGSYTYVVDPIGSLNAGGTTFTSGKPASSFTVVQFGYYSNQRIYPCGGTYWTLLELGRIQVDLHINPDGSYN